MVTFAPLPLAAAVVVAADADVVVPAVDVVAGVVLASPELSSFEQLTPPIITMPTAPTTLSTLTFIVVSFACPATHGRA
ncbi:hypothetical protein MI149_18200 [Mycolicibacterium crocinum]|uniref:Secreted peptide n=1 Tax=Mycolicibacterium crocinum TaxID=388459 RepID=A0ABY3TDW7_9MYCO|nr:hypothetical protein MI149_18200 [Mycolicibacterium crocinum]